MIKILHNNACSKSRAVLEYLDENGVDFEIIDMVENPLSELEIRTVLKKLGTDVHSIIRKHDDLFKNNYADKDFTEDEWIRILSENPLLIQRPILVKGPVAMIGRPVENVKFFIEG